MSRLGPVPFLKRGKDEITKVPRSSLGVNGPNHILSTPSLESDIRKTISPGWFEDQWNWQGDCETQTLLMENMYTLAYS